MRTQTILLTRRCNQACGFCERVQHESADPPVRQIHESIRAAIAAGTSTLIFSGGEPMLRQDLFALVRLARAEGAKQVELETNGTLIPTVAAAKALRTVGVTAVRISLVTGNPERHVRLVGAGTSPVQVLGGIRACLDAGLDVSVRLPIAEGLPSAASRLESLKQMFPSLRHFVLSAALPGEHTFAPGQALSPALLATELTEAYNAARRQKAEVELAPEQPIPPCTVDVKGGARRLFATQFGSESGEPARACDACADCAIAPRCLITPAQLQRAGGPEQVTPIADAASYLHPGRNPGSRLRVLGPDDVEKFFHVDYDFGVDVGRSTSRVGIIYRCNQVCTFCELADMSTQLTPERIRRAIDEAAAKGSYRLIVTGGEPTLSPDLEDHIRYAKGRGFVEIEMQTNAVLLDRPGSVEALRAAGLSNAQVSLHGPDSAVSDRLTAAPGTHQRTLKGVDNLLKNGVVVLLNHLVFKDNCHLLVDFVEMVHARWSAYREQLIIQFHSARNEFPDRDEALAHIARYRDYADTLRRAIDRARELGYETYDLQDPTGIPSLCVLGADEQYLGPILKQAEVPRIHAWERGWFTRVEACKSCEVNDACIGVPKHYVALHGESEFQPLRRNGAPLPAAPPRPEGVIHLRKSTRNV